MVRLQARQRPCAGPAGSKAARFTLDAADNTADFDLWVYVAGSTSVAGLVDLSATGSADEQVTLIGDDFANTTYDIYVAGFAVPGSGAFNLTNYVVGAPTGNLTVPASTPVTQGTPVNVPVSWDVTGTGAGKYLGIVFYDANTYTLISVTA